MFVSKVEFGSIPPVVPYSPMEKGKKLGPNGALYPRGMVQYLLRILVPASLIPEVSVDDQTSRNWL